MIYVRDIFHVKSEIQPAVSGTTRLRGTMQLWWAQTDRDCKENMDISWLCGEFLMNKPWIFRHMKLLIYETYLSGSQNSNHGHSDVSCRTFQQVVTVPGTRVMRYELIWSTCWMQPFILIWFMMCVFVWRVLCWKRITGDARCKTCNVICCPWVRTPLLVWI